MKATAHHYAECLLQTLVLRYRTVSLVHTRLTNWFNGTLTLVAGCNMRVH